MIKFLHLLAVIIMGIFLSLVGYSFYFHSGLAMDRLLYLAVSSAIVYLALLSAHFYKLNLFNPLIISCVACGIVFSILSKFFGIYKEFYMYTPWSELSFLTLGLVLLFFIVRNAKWSKNKVLFQVKKISLKPNLVTVLCLTIILALMKLGVAVLDVTSDIGELIDLVLNTTFTIWSYAFVPVLVVVCLLVFISQKITTNK